MESCTVVHHPISVEMFPAAVHIKQPECGRKLQHHRHNWLDSCRNCFCYHLMFVCPLETECDTTSLRSCNHLYHRCAWGKLTSFQWVCHFWGFWRETVRISLVSSSIVRPAVEDDTSSTLSVTQSCLCSHQEQLSCHLLMRLRDFRVFCCLFWWRLPPD